MDRIIRIMLGLIIILLAVFTATVSHTGLVEHNYRTSIASRYVYNCRITNESNLSNVTFFIPVHADPSVNSQIVKYYSSQEIRGHPADWDIILLYTGKATIAKITTAAINPPEKPVPPTHFTIALSIRTDSGKVINTRSPVEEGVMFRPVQELLNVSRPADSTGTYGDPT
ncbi:MAG: hypothetical protein WCF90_08145 [Methanomicrobiales archaeon]